MEGTAVELRARYDAIIIGGGHNGLTAGAYLAKAGLSVLILERREIVGGCAVSEEVMPGCRVSTASYIASMFMPKVARDLELGRHGLRMVPCDPALSIAAPDGGVVRWWGAPERTAAEIARFSTRDAEAFVRVDRELKRLARYLQPFFLEPPPNLAATGVDRLHELWRVARRFWGISGPEIGQMIAFLTGSLADFLHRHFEAEATRRLFVANNVYGKHGGPHQPGSAMGLLFHLLAGGDHDAQGFSGHVIGGMGSITQALANAARGSGADILTEAEVAEVRVGGGRATGVALGDGREFAARAVLSNADPKRTFLKLVPAAELSEHFRRDVAAIRMNGPSAKVNMVLSDAPRIEGLPADATPPERAMFTAVPTLDEAERCYDEAKLGRLPERLWVDSVTPTFVDDTLAPPGTHMMTCFVQYLPYHLRDGDWDTLRETMADRAVAELAPFIPNLRQSIVARQVLTPLDLERRFGITEGNIFHGDLSLDRLFMMRPLPDWSQYRTPVPGLYLCGAGAHPGGGVTGAPGHNAAKKVLADLKR